MLPPRRSLSLFFLILISAAWLPGQAPGYWHTSGSQILDSNNNPVKISGVNWYGFETTDEVAHGLTVQDYHAILSAIQTNGYNAIRIPFSNQMVESPIVPSAVNFSTAAGPINTDLVGLNSLQILDNIVSAAGALGLYVILDNHRSEAGDSAEANGLWYTDAYPETNWINDWITLTTHYLNNPTVIGLDLRNEPHNATGGGSCWGCGGANDWTLAAERAGNAVLAINPNLLIFVEGTDCYNNDCDWWGGNLEGVQASPVVLSVSGQLVYSAHEYGPNLFGQSWFNGSTSYASLVSIWTKFWAYPSLNGIAPVWIGEFGTTNNDSDVVSTLPGSQGQWFSSLITFFQANPLLNWTYWALNGEDSYALLDGNYDPTPADALKQQQLASIQFNGTLPAGPSCTQIAPVPINLTATAGGASEMVLSWTPVTAPAACAVTYNVYASTTAAFTPSAANRIGTGTAAPSYIAAGLQASTTYYFAVTAVDAAGESNGSAQVSATTPAGGDGLGISCQVTYSVTGQWDVGFNTNLSIQNTGTAPISGWTLSWTWPGNQQIYQSWNANYLNLGGTVELTNAPWNATIPPGAAGTATGIGFLAVYSGANLNPTAFYLNGALCN